MTPETSILVAVASRNLWFTLNTQLKIIGDHTQSMDLIH